MSKQPIDLEGKTILVTGSAGFIGSNLCEAILNLGYKVRCLDDLSTGKQKNVDMFLDNPKYEFVKGDIKDLDTCMNKTTAPCQDKHDNYSVYMTERREKFQYSISVLNAAKLKRKANIYEELPQALKDMDYEGAQYWIYLVIKQSKEDWIVNLNSDLHRQLHPFLKCWNIPDANFFVVNKRIKN